MRVFLASLVTETNTFSPLPTGLASWEECVLFHGDATRHETVYFTGALKVWRQRAETAGYEVIESLTAGAAPAGRTPKAVYESFRHEILDDLDRAGPVDMVLLSLHGAMVAEGYDDCEGDLTQAIRQRTGPDAIIGMELDLHAHLTADMVAAADVIVSFKEYPHVDIEERAEEVWRLCHDAALRKTRPVMSVYDCRMINLWRTPGEPMRGFVDRMQALEGKDKVLSVSFCHGFPWGDVPDSGAKLLVITDNDLTKGDRLAAQLGQELWQMREATRDRSMSLDEALDRAMANPGGPVVIADVADNAGGGAASDSTFFLKRMLERGIKSAAIGGLWDPIAVRICEEAGLGTKLPLRIGGKCSSASGNPVDLDVEVKGLGILDALPFGKTTFDLGASAWVAGSGIDIILVSTRNQCFHPDVFARLGCDPSTRKIVVPKSTQHFYATFAPFAADVLYATTPGSMQPNFAAIPYVNSTRPLWPQVENPWA